jgi:hypothetical protein
LPGTRREVTAFGLENIAMRFSCIAGFIAALALNAFLPSAAIAKIYPPHTECSPLEGTAHLSCSKQMNDVDRSGVHSQQEAQGASAPGSSPPSASAGLSHRAGTTGANTSIDHE